MTSVAEQLRLPKEPSTIAIIDVQWGDTGKGKFVDVLSEWADIIARGTGGANAGHTICIGNRTHVFHLIPSGILRDSDDKMNIIGTGVALDLHILCEEFDLLELNGLSFDHLRISRDAHVVLPQHLLFDRLKEASLGGKKIGTTGRGIGPLYGDRVARTGLTMLDLLNPATFRTKLRRNLDEKAYFIRCVDPEMAKAVMGHEHLEKGRFYHPETIFDQDAIIKRYLQYASRIRDMVCDTDTLLRQQVGKRNILLEGAQGVLLSVDHGIHPHVTSSDCSLAGLVKGVGLREKDVDRVFSIVKAPYMTRVGEGVFPTELGGERSEEWCSVSGQSADKEREAFPAASVNSDDPFEQGIGVRQAGNEYGATTRRPRRTGWLDLPLLRYALQFAGQELILTKVDVLDTCERILICNAHLYRGPIYDMGDYVLHPEDLLVKAIPNSEILRHVSPCYQDFPGWQRDISGARTRADLPLELLDIVSFIEKQTKTAVVAVSVGRERDQTVYL
ncbi:adenylosuccinate synthetase [Patescibacteria group bacterium]|nr:adenylosuccinate synthetase [Patescibacteria group bacterium]